MTGIILEVPLFYRLKMIGILLLLVSSSPGQNNTFSAHVGRSVTHGVISPITFSRFERRERRRIHTTRRMVDKIDRSFQKTESQRQREEGNSKRE